MPPKAREKAIEDAFARGDTEVLASIRVANPLVWGGVKAPLDVKFQLYIQKADPQFLQRVEAANMATEILGMAAQSLFKSVKEWSDPAAAERGAMQEQQFAEAQASLSAAISE